MPAPKFVRDNAFNLARHDLALFLEEHEQDLLNIFREEIQQLDEDLPEEEVYIDLDMVGLGEMLLIAVLRAMRRFLIEIPTSTPQRWWRRRTPAEGASPAIHIPVQSKE